MGRRNDNNEEEEPRQPNIWSQDRDANEALALANLGTTDANLRLAFPLNIDNQQYGLLGVPGIPSSTLASESLLTGNTQTTLMNHPWNDDRGVITPGITQARVQDAENGQ